MMPDWWKCGCGQIHSAPVHICDRCGERRIKRTSNPETENAQLRAQLAGMTERAEKAEYLLNAVYKEKETLELAYVDRIAERDAAVRDLMRNPCLECDPSDTCHNCKFAALKANTSGIPIDDLEKMCQAWKEGRYMEMPFVAMIEQSLQDGKMRPQTDQKHNGRYAVVYNSAKWSTPLIDICGTHYNAEQAEIRRDALKGAAE